ncbi:MAG: hypothetical protein IJK61_02725 [Bacteroidetes bacterium]|nr:hypothetical protein [Bacteroidota bacterium]
MNSIIKRTIFLFTMCFSLALAVNSCIIVKEKDEYIVKTEKNTANVAPKPEVKMSDMVIRANTGDMLALIPDGWFFIETNEQVSSDVFAVAVNPDYTLAAIFSTLKKTEENVNIIDKENLLGLARLCYAKHAEKAIGALELTEKYEVVDVGTQKFANYAFVHVTNGSPVKSTVFISEIGNYYEFSLISMTNVSNNLPVSQTDFDKYFRSILATIKY